MVIGVDLDNTVVSYDSLLHSTACERGLIDGAVSTSKREVREAIRELPNGETHWRKLQGMVYGPRMLEATLIPGVKEFFKVCKQRQIPVYIVSHKTEYAEEDETKTDLRDAALSWMGNNGLFDGQITGLSQKSVSFEPTRLQKLNRIATLGCTHFIDDLEETFLEDSFPSDVEKILFSPSRQDLPPQGVKLLYSWADIKGYLLGVDS